MAQRGKNVNVFLIDGRATGRIKCTLANWTGIVIEISVDRKAEYKYD